MTYHGRPTQADSVHELLWKIHLRLNYMEDQQMTQSDDITLDTNAIQANTAILTDVKAAVDALKSNPQIDPALLTQLDAAVAGNGAAASSLATDVNVDQPPAPTTTPIAPATS